MRWFELTYELQGGFGWVQWQRRLLPEVGGVADQPSRLMEALAFVGQAQNAALRRAQKEPPSHGDGETPRRKRRKG